MSKDMVREVANTFKCANAVANNGKCNNEFQDERYGKDMRVFTNLGGGEKAGSHKRCCTVCGDKS